MPEESNRRILIVDDERDIVQAYTDFLRPAPGAARRSSRLAAPTSEAPATAAYELFTATSGEEALAICERELAAGRRIAGGFIDVQMEGGIDGLETIQRIWKLDPELHCTVVTAYHDRNVDDIDQLFGSRFKDQWDYLNKPFTQAEIVQKARQMTAAWNRKRSLESALAQLRAAQDQLVRSERMAAIGQVARGVGHEFGNILQTIVGRADLGTGEDDPARMHELFRIILQASERASLIVRNLQSFSRASLTRSACRFGRLIKDTLVLIGHQLKKAGIEVVEAVSDCAAFEANAAEIEQVLMNLMINAIHAMPEGGRLELGCRDEGALVVAWVKDTGTGIPADVLPHIFEYAYTTKGERGSGLGLSISSQLVAAHGGTLTVETAPGQGSTFFIRIPRIP